MSLESEKIREKKNLLRRQKKSRFSLQKKRPRHKYSEKSLTRLEEGSKDQEVTYSLNLIEAVEEEEEGVEVEAEAEIEVEVKRGRSD